MAALDAGQPASITAADTTATAAAAEAEALTLEALTSELKSLPRDKALIALQQSFPNPVLTSLMQKRMEAEQKLAELQQEYGTNHTEVIKTKALVATINKQIEDQLVSALRGPGNQARCRQEDRRNSSGPSRRVRSTAKDPGFRFSERRSHLHRSRGSQTHPGPDQGQPGPDQRQKMPAGATPLHDAAYKGQLVVAEFLLANGADVAAKNTEGWTPLHSAAANGHKSHGRAAAQPPGQRSSGGL